MTVIPDIVPVTQAPLEARIKSATGVVPGQLNVTHRMLAWAEMNKEAENQIALATLVATVKANELMEQMADASDKMADAVDRAVVSAETVAAATKSYATSMARIAAATDGQTLIGSS